MQSARRRPPLTILNRLYLTLRTTGEYDATASRLLRLVALLTGAIRKEAENRYISRQEAEADHNTIVLAMADLRRDLTTETQSLRSELASEAQSLRTELAAETQGLRCERHDLRTKMHGLHSNMHATINRMTFAIIGAIMPDWHGISD